MFKSIILALMLTGCTATLQQAKRDRLHDKMNDDISSMDRANSRVSVRR